MAHGIPASHLPPAARHAGRRCEETEPLGQGVESGVSDHRAPQIVIHVMCHLVREEPYTLLVGQDVPKRIPDPQDPPPPQADRSVAGVECRVHQDEVGWTRPDRPAHLLDR